MGWDHGTGCDALGIFWVVLWLDERQGSLAALLAKGGILSSDVLVRLLHRFPHGVADILSVEWDPAYVRGARGVDFCFGFQCLLLPDGHVESSFGTWLIRVWYLQQAKC